MALFSKAQHKLLGIDISSTAVKLIELSRSESKGQFEYTVDAFASSMLPPGSVDARKIKDTDAVSDVVRDVVKSGMAINLVVSRIEVGVTLGRVGSMDRC